ncbi:transketolase C-terminal domain-containing protein [Halocella sp. SP3-1]|uniref:transketolase family protein n=1 Tax=Halocella sp. SP3-1 TaxID=2382161 RepID=UPI0013DF4000
MMKDMPTREAFGIALLEMAEEKDDLIVLDADISKSTNSCYFHQKYPERAYNVGIAEQNMIGVAAGIASTGMQVFATTYAVFATMRALEQVRTFICYPKLNVKVIASHGGLQVSSDGVSHQGTEDLAFMRAIPNMTVLHPADPVSTKKLIHLAGEFEGPMYIRLMRNAVPVIYDKDINFEIGKGIINRDADDAVCTIMATGLMVYKSLEAARNLAESGIETRVIDLHTIKPLDKKLIIESAQKTGAVVTAEDHNICGGLGGAIAEVLGKNYPVPMEMIGVKDVFGESGDPEELFTEYDMNTKDIVGAVQKVLNKK